MKRFLTKNPLLRHYRQWRRERMDRRIQRQVEILYKSLTRTIEQEKDICLLIRTIDHRAWQSSETIREINAMCDEPALHKAMSRINRRVDYIGKDNQEAREQLTPVLMFGCRSYREYMQAIDRMLYKRYLESCNLTDAEDVADSLSDYFRAHPEDRPVYWHMLQNCRRLLGDLHARALQNNWNEQSGVNHLNRIETEDCPPGSGHPGRSV